MAKRIAIKNNCNTDKESFWIFNKLKRRGFIAGKYEVIKSDKNNGDLFVNETIIPKLFDRLNPKDQNFQAEYDDLEDLRELLNLSNKNTKKRDLNSWEEVLPLYPLSPIN